MQGEIEKKIFQSVSTPEYFLFPNRNIIVQIGYCHCYFSREINLFEEWRATKLSMSVQAI